MAFAINKDKDIDGKCEMYTKYKSLISPGLVNLLFLELGFLLLAAYIGLCMWTGLPAAGNAYGMEFVVGLVLFFTVFCRKR